MDQSSVPPLAVPICVPNTYYEIGYNTSNLRSQAIGDLELVAFYYLLRVGKYTKPTKVK